MTEKQWHAVKILISEFRDFCTSAAERYNNDTLLLECQQEIIQQFHVPQYPLENMVVYNKRLDELTKENDIKLILIGDNPGKNEQLSCNCRYLVGQAGKLAHRFFSINPELNIDFDTEVIILNKSPLHTAKTAYLKQLLSSYEKKTHSAQLHTFFLESQTFMADFVYRLQSLFNCYVFLVGYSEVASGHIFEQYHASILECYKNNSKLQKKFLCFQHFSMNRFTIDLKNNYNKNTSLFENIIQLGSKHRKRIFSF